MLKFVFFLGRFELVEMVVYLPLKSLQKYSPTPLIFCIRLQPALTNFNNLIMTFQNFASDWRRRLKPDRFSRNVLKAERK